MPTVRRPAVAGLFYPASSDTLRSTVQDLLRQAPQSGAPAPKAVIAPHAGYVYSGPIAATAFQALAAREALRRVIVLGPAHRVPVRGVALPGVEAFATPLGEVAVDTAAAEAIFHLPQVTTSPEAHAPEHSLEVELPFLQVLFPEIQVLPLVVGDASGDEVAEVLDLVWGGTETAIVVSSDLSHYLPYEAARRADRETAGEIAALAGPLHSRQACGAYPINGLLVAARQRGMTAQLLDLRNSGDTAGDKDRVVGYGAFAFSEAA
jgi:AmmeMemoRadiSam system protein B